MKTIRLLMLLLLWPVYLPAKDCDSHHYAGRPLNVSGVLICRTGYELCWNRLRMVPNYVAYHSTADNLRTPKREGRFARFSTDRQLWFWGIDISDGRGGVIAAAPERLIHPNDYAGMNRHGYARGHMAPYAVSGGDRDGDGVTAKDDDPEDQQAVMEFNLMGNIAPQHQLAFNGASGMWYKVERFIRDRLLRREHREVWVTAGTIFGPGPTETIGPGIAVPPLFWQLVVYEDAGQPVVLAFLLPHHKVAHGQIEDYLVSADIVEALTGLDLLPELDDVIEAVVEAADTFSNWRK